jgi:hypothetical protein
VGCCHRVHKRWAASHRQAISAISNAKQVSDTWEAAFAGVMTAQQAKIAQVSFVNIIHFPLAFVHRLNTFLPVCYCCI